MTDAIRQHAEFPDNIDHYPAGPDLDCLLAERILGARVGRYKEWTGYENWVATTPDGAQFFVEVSPHAAYGAVPLWNPSTNVLDAQVLVRHLSEFSDYRSMTEDGTDEDGYSVTLWAHRSAPDPVSNRGLTEEEPQAAQTYSVTGSGPTLALAICRAVYQAASDVTRRQAGNK